jgi:hypothetical protein
LTAKKIQSQYGVGRENEEPETLEVTLAELAQLSADPDVEFIHLGSCDLLGG